MPLFTPIVDRTTGCLVSCEPVDLTVEDCQLVQRAAPEHDPSFLVAAAIYDGLHPSQGHQAVLEAQLRELPRHL